MSLLQILQLTNQRLPLMRQPAYVNEATERALGAVDA